MNAFLVLRELGSENYNKKKRKTFLHDLFRPLAFFRFPFFNSIVNINKNLFNEL